MRIIVDHDRCDTYGVCEQTAPEVFEVGDDDLLHVRLDPVPEQHASAVEEAVRSCPKLALSLRGPS